MYTLHTRDQFPGIRYHRGKSLGKIRTFKSGKHIGDKDKPRLFTDEGAFVFGITQDNVCISRIAFAIMINSFRTTINAFSIQITFRFNIHSTQSDRRHCVLRVRQDYSPLSSGTRMVVLCIPSFFRRSISVLANTRKSLRPYQSNLWSMPS